MTLIQTGTPTDSATVQLRVPPVLSAENVTVRFGGIVALDGVSVQAAPGAVTGIVGPNGAGKTTLFAVLSGLLRPTEGTVAVNGAEVTRMRPHNRARQGIARTFQRVELFASMTVRDHLVVAHRLARRRKVHGDGWVPDTTEAVDALLAQLGLESVAYVDAGTLPLGTARLVEIGRALVTAPRVLLLDEPCSGLDAEQTQRVVGLLQHHAKGAALVLVEHNVDLVLQLSEFVYVLDAGKLIAADVPAAIAKDPVVHAAYLGDDFAMPGQTG
jgi:ABC-type branched-subunit amino acid transport system ATPase component